FTAHVEEGGLDAEGVEDILDLRQVERRRPIERQGENLSRVGHGDVELVGGGIPSDASDVVKVDVKIIRGNELAVMIEINLQVPAVVIIDDEADVVVGVERRTDVRIGG